VTTVDQDPGSSEAAPVVVEALLELHADIYRPDVVERAATAFSQVAQCSIERLGPYLRVHLRALGGRDASVLRQQFANWALAAATVDRA
jgi:hypothetical protein